MVRTHWRLLAAELNTYPEEQVLQMLNEERVGERRAAILRRLHQRYAALRTARERAEIMKDAV